VTKINLLDYRKLKRIMQLQKEFFIYLLEIAFALVTIGIFWQNQNSRIKEII
jgi:hypothetical protein